ncbi:MAG TPA: hypothetical protein VMS71_02925, partial [Candidatus Acidoferrum sp.]|nr:hypothetical protein [Candidatus Acidoferrum sp.]
AILSRREHRTNASVKALYRRFDYSFDEVCFLLPDDHRCRPLEYRTAAALMTLLILDDWCRLTPIQQIEQQFQVHVGQIMGAGETAAHLILGMAALIESEDMTDPAVAILRQHAFSLRFGIPAELEDLYQDTKGLLRRSELAALSQLGLDASGDLGTVSQEQLSAIIKDKTRLDALSQICQHRTKEISMNAPYLTPCRLAGARPSSIEIDGSLQGDRYLVKIDGFPVYLTGKSFKYFTKLAWSRANRDGGWIYKEDIEIGFNQARYLYRMKNEMNTFLRSNWPIFENNRLGYYRLDLEPEKVSINFENLKLHSDHELRVLSAPARPAPAQVSTAAPC